MSIASEPNAQALSAEVGSLRRQVKEQADEIERLKWLVAKYKRMHFGQRTEHWAPPGQIELDLEFAAVPLSDEASAAAQETSMARPLHHRTRQRNVFPDDLPRETVYHTTEEETCPECGGHLKPLGEDVSEMLEYVPASFKVVRHVRPKLACAACDHIA